MYTTFKPNIKYYTQFTPPLYLTSNNMHNVSHHLLNIIYYTQCVQPLYFISNTLHNVSHNYTLHQILHNVYHHHILNQILHNVSHSYTLHPIFYTIPPPPSIAHYLYYVYTAQCISTLQFKSNTLHYSSPPPSIAHF